MLLEIHSVKFPRFVKPISANNKENPDLYIFGDSNPDSFGSVAYAVFEIESGAKESILLGPILRKVRPTEMKSTVLHT